MALVNEVALDSIPTIMETGSTYHASHLRRLAKALGITGSGVVGTGGAVTAQGTPNMTVAVAQLSALISGTQDALHQGSYIAETFASKNVTVQPADASNPRIDRLVIGVFDQEYAGARYAGVLGLVQGTPAASPAVPALPTDGTFLELAQIQVRAATSSIITTDITDKRVRWDLLPPSQSLQTAPFTAAGRFVGRMTTAGAPASGTWLQGDHGYDSIGGLWQCITAGTPGTWVLAGPVRYDSQILGSAASSIAVSSLPSGYRHMMIRALLRSDQSGTGAQAIGLRLNSDSGTNYAQQRFDAIGTTLTGQSTTPGSYVDGWFIPQNGVLANYFGYVEIWMNDYSSATKLKTGRINWTTWQSATFTGAAMNSDFVSFIWNSTAAVNAFSLFTPTGNLLTGSEAQTYLWA